MLTLGREVDSPHRQNQIVRKKKKKKDNNDDNDSDSVADSQTTDNEDIFVDTYKYKEPEKKTDQIQINQTQPKTEKEKPVYTPPPTKKTITQIKEQALVKEKISPNKSLEKNKPVYIACTNLSASLMVVQGKIDTSSSFQPSLLYNTDRG